MAEGRVDDPMEVIPTAHTFGCMLCGKNGLSENDMKFHIMVEHLEENVCCPFCDENCLTTEKLNRHVKDEHMDILSPSTRDQDCFPDDIQNGDSHWSETRLHETSKLVTDSVNEEDENDIESFCIENDKKRKEKSRNGDTHDFHDDSHDDNHDDICDDNHDDTPNKPDSKRSKLHLDVPKSFNGTHLSQNGNSSPTQGKQLDMPGASVTSPTTPDHAFHCPICCYSTDSEVSIQQHVNRDHKDILSPMKSQEQEVEEENFNMLYTCPICASKFDNPRSLEIHLNLTHVDILSPCNGTKSGMASPGGQGQEDQGQDDQMACSNGSGDLSCPVCDLEFNDPMSLSTHVDGHFSAEHTPVSEMTDALLAEELQRSEDANAHREKKDFQMLQAMYGMDEKASYKQQYEKSLERAVWKGDLTISEFFQQKTKLQTNDLSGVDDGHSATKGIVPNLHQFYKKCPGFVQQAWLCSNIDHYSGSYGDKGWGCGYRNLQMMLSSLASDPNFCKILFNGRALIPSIPKIQRLIETAWEKGFDKQGCEQLGGRVVNTRKWIGATEIVATLSALKMKCQLVDFHSPSSPDGTHPKLFQWVKEYFSPPGVFKPPLYLQHQGHSRTIIGYEEMRDKTARLLIFDPSTPRKQMIQFTGFLSNNMMRTLRRTMNGLRAKQYQLVAVVGVLTDKEYEESKVMKSERIS